MTVALKNLVLLGRICFLLGLFPFVLSVPAADAVPAVGEEAAAGADGRKRLRELRREIARHDDLYFRVGMPEISDFEYDQLKAELRRLEELYSNFEVTSSNGFSLGDDRTGTFATHRHRVPMLSLNKAMSDEDLAAFHRRIRDQIGRDEIAYWVEPKYDGIAISLVYERGKLTRAVTRGNGFEGDVVTANVRALAGVPETLEREGDVPVPDFVEIRGEIYMTFEAFDRINDEQIAAGEPVFANPRNLAVGTLKLHDPGEFAERNLSLVCFGWGAFEPVGARPDTLTEFRSMLEVWGLPTVERAVSAIGLAEMVATVRGMERSRTSLAFPVDGAVIKLVRTGEQELLGWGATAPHWAVARKFAPERVTTRLLGITFQVGRTGVITPVAELEPVQLGGATVSRATLHNADEIKRRDLRIGDLIYLEKAGDIIPAIAGVDLSQRPAGSRRFSFPAACPDCDSPLERREGQALYRCINDDCPAIAIRQIVHFASGTAMNIRGLGTATIEALVREGAIRTPVDLYRLTIEDLLPIVGMGERSAEKLLAAIEASRKADWERVILGLGFPGIGARRAADLAGAFPGFSALKAARWEQLIASVNEGGAGLGESVAARVVAHLEKPGTQKLLRDLEELGLGSVSSKKVAFSGNLVGETIVFTGTLQQWTRAEITALVRASGAQTSGNVTRSTTLLVAGEKPGAKLIRAQELGVMVIDEAELARRLETKP